MIEEMPSTEPEPDNSPHPDSWEPFLTSPAGILVALTIALAATWIAGQLLG